LGIVEYEQGPIDFAPGGGTIPGDYNGNGRVEQADLDLVLLNWGAALAQPWVDGTVDQAELDGVLLNWGNEAAGGLVSAAVPEPSGTTLGAIALLLFVLLSSPRRSKSPHA
jgi:hypothetical protein